MDNYYLNNAVYLTEEFLEATKNPAYGGEVDYGDRAEHCWNGDHTPAERDLAPPVPSDVHPESRRTDAENSAARGRSQELALLIPNQFLTSRASGSETAPRSRTSLYM